MRVIEAFPVPVGNKLPRHLFARYAAGLVVYQKAGAVQNEIAAAADQYGEESLKPLYDSPIHNENYTEGQAGIKSFYPLLRPGYHDEPMRLPLFTEAAGGHSDDQHHDGLYVLELTPTVDTLLSTNVGIPIVNGEVLLDRCQMYQGAIPTVEDGPDDAPLVKAMRSAAETTLGPNYAQRAASDAELRTGRPAGLPHDFLIYAALHAARPDFQEQAALAKNIAARFLVDGNNSDNPFSQAYAPRMAVIALQTASAISVLGRVFREIRSGEFNPAAIPAPPIDDD